MLWWSCIIVLVTERKRKKWVWTGVVLVACSGEAASVLMCLWARAECSVTRIVSEKQHASVCSVSVGQHCVVHLARARKCFSELAYSKCSILKNVYKLQCMQAWWITVLPSVSLSLGPSVAVNIFDWCLVRSWTFAGPYRFIFYLFLAKLQNVVGPTYSNEWQQTSNVARNWCRQWPTTDLIQCHPPWPGICQSWYVLTSDLTSWHNLRDGLSNGEIV